MIFSKNSGVTPYSLTIGTDFAKGRVNYAYLNAGKQGWFKPLSKIRVPWQILPNNTNYELKAMQVGLVNTGRTKSGSDR